MEISVYSPPQDPRHAMLTGTFGEVALTNLCMVDSDFCTEKDSHVVSALTTCAIVVARLQIG